MSRDYHRGVPFQTGVAHVVRRLEAAVDEAFERAVDRERTERYALSPTELAELLHAASRPQKAG